MSLSRSFAPIGLCALGALLAAPSVVHAQTYAVHVNTDALNGLGTYYAEFTLTDGTASGAGNSQGVISNFQVSGGSLGAVVPPVTGDAIGDLGSTLTLQSDDATTQGLADFAQAFTVTGPASALTFDLSLTGTAVSAPAPDNFTFDILDSTQTAIPTTGPTGFELVTADYTTTQPMPQGYSAVSSSVAATVTPNIAAVPEPSALSLLALALPLGAGALRARRRQRPGG